MELKQELKKKIDGIVEKIKNDPQLLKNFEKEPVKVIESLIDVDLPDDQLEPVVAAVKAKLAAGSLGDKLGGLKKLF